MLSNVDHDQPHAAEAAGPLRSLRWFTFALFFVFGGITSLNDVVIPKLRELFTLTHASAMLVQTAFFLAYAIFSLPRRPSSTGSAICARRPSAC